MAKLYVMNCKKQDQSFSFRVPEVDKTGNIIRYGQLITQKIPKGQQIQVYRDDSEAILRAIIGQHDRYGVVHVSNLDLTKPFINLAWQLDKPMTLDQITRGFNHNHEVLTERGEQQRQTAAAAVDQHLKAVADDLGDAAGATEVSFKDETPGDTNSGVEHTVIVDPLVSEREHGKRQRGRPRARA